jgi:hypothetical protein
MRCPSCATELPAGSRFCLSCGQPIDSPSGVVTSPGAAVARGVNRLVSSEAILVGGLTPGSMLAGRYRIIGLLGRGGMGEVYRADDVKLGQTVALKFLPREMSTDAVWRERFFAEVRITRQLSHPNICRVYDVADLDGRHFLSMEFIDGEDLASLLKRIGHLSNEKALDIARQLAAGLAAAHERGVLHRDLKPANIMIDGHGRVRITDFGLAVGITSDPVEGEVAGTPAYMAPEQLAGKGASVRSDIYALGLVLYEVCCGKPAFSAKTIAELRDEKEHSTLRPPSDLRPGIDPGVERAIVRCLERDPRMRPASAAQLATSLPGGDPLAAAIAAGETPSPELVAASGLKEGLTPGVATALLAVVVGGSLATVWLNDRVGLVPNAKPSKAPDAMVERARAVLAKAGYTDDARDSGFGFYVDDDVIRYVIDQRPVASRSGDLRSLGAVRFFYRHSPVPLVSPGFGAGIEAGDPPLQRDGDMEVRLDGDGRLRSFEAIPVHGQASQTAAPDWSGLFSEAGFDPAAWRSVEPQQVPRSYADTRVAWEGFSGDGGTPARIEAAAYEGRPVAFAVVGPWKPDRSSNDVRSTGGATPGTAVARLGPLAPLLTVVVFLVGAFFARRNLRYGRGDRRGATRLSVFDAAMFAVAWLFTEHHVTSPAEGFLFLVVVGVTVSAASFVWIFYTAVEPFIRRRWPQILVAWARVLAGNWRDPLVGRDALIGCATGVLSACLTNLVRLVAWERGQAVTLLAPDWNMFTGTRPFIGALAAQISISIFISVFVLFAFFLLRIVLRHDWAAIGLFVVFSGGLRILGASFSWATIPAIVVGGGVRTFVLVRIGLVAAFVDGFVWTLLMSSPMTLQTSAWYASAGYASLAVVGAIAVYGFRTALGGRPVLDGSAIAD